MRKISELENNSNTIKNLDEKLNEVREFSGLAIEENDEKSKNNQSIKGTRTTPCRGQK